MQLEWYTVFGILYAKENKHANGIDRSILSRRKGKKRDEAKYRRRSEERKKIINIDN